MYLGPVIFGDRFALRRPIICCYLYGSDILVVHPKNIVKLLQIIRRERP